MNHDTLSLIKSFSYGVLVPLFTYTGISSELISILFVLIIIDIITGLLREKVVGSKITSTALWVGLASKLLLMTIPFVLVLVGKGVNINLSPISGLALSTFIVAEGYSILGNIVQIRAKDKTIDEQDAITMVIKKAQSIIRNILSEFIKK